MNILSSLSSLMIIGLIVLYILSKQGMIDTSFDEMVDSLIQGNVESESLPVNEMTESPNTTTPSASTVGNPVSPAAPVVTTPPVPATILGSDKSNIIKQFIIRSNQNTLKDIQDPSVVINCASLNSSVQTNKTKIGGNMVELKGFEPGKKPDGIKSERYLRCTNNTGGCFWIGFSSYVTSPNVKITFSCWIRVRKDLTTIVAPNRKSLVGIGKYPPGNYKNSFLDKVKANVWTKIVEEIQPDDQLTSKYIVIFDGINKGESVDICDITMSTDDLFPLTVQLGPGDTNNIIHKIVFSDAIQTFYDIRDKNLRYFCRDAANPKIYKDKNTMIKVDQGHKVEIIKFTKKPAIIESTRFLRVTKSTDQAGCAWVGFRGDSVDYKKQVHLSCWIRVHGKLKDLIVKGKEKEVGLRTDGPTMNNFIDKVPVYTWTKISATLNKLTKQPYSYFFIFDGVKGKTVIDIADMVISYV